MAQIRVMGNRKKTNGRSERRSKTLQVRLTPAEHALIEQAAAQRGQKVSAYSRAVLKRAAVR